MELSSSKIKIILILSEMELSSSKIKKLPIFPDMRNETFLYVRKELSKLEKQKKSTL